MSGRWEMREDRRVSRRLTTIQSVSIQSWRSLLTDGTAHVTGPSSYIAWHSAPLPVHLSLRIRSLFRPPHVFEKRQKTQ